METKRFDAPALYADHHVMEARRLLLELQGVADVYASSAFRVIEVQFDPKKIKAAQIESCLQAAGYLGEFAILAEPEVATGKRDPNGSFRHTAVYETLKGTVAFAQSVKSTGRPLWPCPGFGVIEMES